MNVGVCLEWWKLITLQTWNMMLARELASSHGKCNCKLVAAEGQGRGRQQPETISEVPLDKPRLSRYMHSEVCAFGKGSRLSSDDVTNSTHEAGLYGRGQSVSRSVSRGILYLPRCVWATLFRFLPGLLWCLACSVISRLTHMTNLHNLEIIRTYMDHNLFS